METHKRGGLGAKLDIELPTLLDPLAKTAEETKMGQRRPAFVTLEPMLTASVA